MKSELIKKSESSIESTELNKRAIQSTEKLITILVKIITFCEEHKLCNNALQQNLDRLENYYKMIIPRYGLLAMNGSIAFTNHELIIQTQLFIYKYEGGIKEVMIIIDDISHANILCLCILENVLLTKNVFEMTQMCKKFEFIAKQLEGELPNNFANYFCKI
jgi:hypothetical protein